MIFQAVWLCYFLSAAVLVRLNFIFSLQCVLFLSCISMSYRKVKVVHVAHAQMKLKQANFDCLENHM